MHDSDTRRSRHVHQASSCAEAESEYVLVVSASELLGLDARPTLPFPPCTAWLVGDERCGVRAAPTAVRTTMKRGPGAGLERVLGNGGLNKLYRSIPSEGINTSFKKIQSIALITKNRMKIPTSKSCSGSSSTCGCELGRLSQTTVRDVDRGGGG